MPSKSHLSRSKFAAVDIFGFLFQRSHIVPPIPQPYNNHTSMPSYPIAYILG